MSDVRVAGPAVAEMAARLRAVATAIAAGARTVRDRFDAVDWADGHERQMRADLATLLQALGRDADRISAQAQWLAALAGQVADLATGSPAGSVPGLVRDAPRSPPKAESPDARTAVDPFARMTMSPRLVGIDGRAMRLVDATRFAIDDFDWLTEDPGRDLLRPHHGRAADEYMDLLRGAQPWLRQAAAGEEPSVGEPAGRAALLGADAVRVERGGDGRIVITDGRHRLWAALSGGMLVPLIVVDSERRT